MRTYKFRGYDAIGQKGWVYGDLTHTKGLDNSRESFLYDRVMVGGYEVDEDSVGLSTGLTDRNGTEIFEGDILRVYSDSNALCDVIVVWRDAGFYLHDSKNTYSPLKTWMLEKYTEIITSKYINEHG